MIRITLGISTHDHICSEADVAFTMVIYRRSVLAPESDILVAESKTTLPLSLTNAIKTMKAKRRELKSGFLVGLHDSHGHLLKTD